jgi:SAM-dependent methyltransferase
MSSIAIEPADGLASLQGQAEDRACPACRSGLDEGRCLGCGRSYPTVAGMLDLRLVSDRYLPLGDERARAEELASLGLGSDWLGLAGAYYDRTGDPRRGPFLRHIAGAEWRGRALAARLPLSGRILEVGCGTGGLLVAAARRGLGIEGADIASRWLVVAGARLRAAGVPARLTPADAGRLPWPDATFSAVVADSVLEHLDDPAAALCEWARVLEPGGMLLLWSPNRWSLAPDPHVHLWGVNWLPRPRAVAHARRRRGGLWLPHVRSAREAAGFLHPGDWDAAETRAPDLSGCGGAGRQVAAYESIRRAPGGRAFLARFGPLWELRARRGGRGGAA